MGSCKMQFCEFTGQVVNSAGIQSDILLMIESVVEKKYHNNLLQYF